MITDIALFIGGMALGGLGGIIATGVAMTRRPKNLMALRGTANTDYTAYRTTKD